MARRTIEVESECWAVYLSGRVNSYSRDQLAVVFELGSGENAIKRVCRFRPTGKGGAAAALQALSDASLRDMLQASQPAWTSPELNYDRSTRPA